LTVTKDGISIGNFDFSLDDGITIWSPELSATRGNTTAATRIGVEFSDGTEKGTLESGYTTATPAGNYEIAATATAELRLGRIATWGTATALTLYGIVRLATVGDPSALRQVPQYIH
jgi:hypothetical protein